MLRALLYAFFGYIILETVMKSVGGFYSTQPIFFYLLVYPVVVYGGTIVLGIAGFMVDRKKKQSVMQTSPAANIARRVIAWIFIFAGAAGFLYLAYGLLSLISTAVPNDMSSFALPYAYAFMIGGIIFSTVIFSIGFATIRELKKELQPATK